MNNVMKPSDLCYDFFKIVTRCYYFIEDYMKSLKYCDNSWSSTTQVRLVGGRKLKNSSRGGNGGFRSPTYIKERKIENLYLFVTRLIFFSSLSVTVSKSL